MTRRKRQLLNTAEDLSQARDLGNVTQFEPRRETVGELLRRAREGKGRDLEAVATRLRIRPTYLKAIEAGRFQDLPGLTYAVGFVRTYADHLGLDAEDVVRRFRDEVAELKSQTQLIFPVGVAAEGKMPRGAILLLSAVLAAIAYGGWYYLSEREQSPLDLVPELPAKLRALISGEEPAAEVALEPQPGVTVPSPAPAEQPPAPGVAEPAPAPAQGGAAAPQAATQAAAPVAEAVPAPSPVPEVEAPSDPVAESAAAASALPSPAPGTPPTAEGSAASAALMSENSAGTAPAPAAPAPAAPMTAPAAAPTVAPGNATGIAAGPAPQAPAAPSAPAFDSAGLPTVPAPVPAAPSTGTLAAAPAGEPAGLPPITDGQAFGAVEGPSRIVVVARLESWVQVTDPETNALLTRVLRAGDRYYVPDEAGLSLATGNAGGIDIWVDGRKTPGLGPVGVVRRGIALDPQRLMSGTALPE